MSGGGRLAVASGALSVVGAVAAAVGLVAWSGDGTRVALSAMVQSGAFARPGAGVLACALVALFVGVSTRRPSVTPALALLPIALPPVVFAAGAWAGLRDFLAQLTTNDPGDRLAVALGGEGELLQQLAVGLMAAAALSVGAAAGSALGAVAGLRAQRFATAAMAALLGASAWSLSTRLGAFAAAHEAVTHASPTERVAVFVASLHVPAVASIADWGLLAAVVSSLAIAAWSRRASGVVCTVLVVLGLRGSVLLVERQQRQANAAIAGQAVALEVLDGMAFFGDHVTEVQRGAELEASLRAGATREGQVSVALTPGLTWGVLERALQAAHRLGLTVELVGRPRPSSVQLPEGYEAVMAGWSNVPTAAQLELRWADEDCAGCEGAATWVDGRLVVHTPEGAQTWERQGRLPEVVDGFGRVEIDWSGSPRDLGLAAVVALSHRQVLVVRLPRS